MPGNQITLGSGADAATLAMVLHMRCTGVSTRAGWNVSDGAVGKAGVDAGGNASLFLGVSVAPAWQACVGACLSAAHLFVPRWVIRRSWSAWTCKSATENSITLMVSRIWSS